MHARLLADNQTMFIEPGEIAKVELFVPLLPIYLLERLFNMSAALPSMKDPVREMQM